MELGFSIRSNARVADFVEKFNWGVIHTLFYKQFYAKIEFLDVFSSLVHRMDLILHISNVPSVFDVFSSNRPFFALFL